MGITVQATGSLDSRIQRLRKMTNQDIYNILARYGPVGVQALAEATPSRSGETANSWTYEIRQSKGSHELVWINTHNVQGANIAVLLQYGHGTGTGGYITGRDYINPAMRPVFDKILADIGKAVRA